MNFKKISRTLILGTSLLKGQTLINLTPSSGQSTAGSQFPVDIIISRTSLNVTVPSGILFSAVVDSNKLSIVSSFTTVPGKTLTCRNNMKGYTCLLIGKSDKNNLPLGSVCTLLIKIKDGVKPGLAAVILGNTQATTPAGIFEGTAGSIGFITVK